MRGVGVLHVVEAVVVGLPDLQQRAGDRGCRPRRVTDPSTQQGSPGGAAGDVAAVLDRRASRSTKNGPSTVASVTSPVGRVVDVIVCIDSPSTSESRMNSCRLSSVMCPASVRNSIAAAHSASVSRTSRMNACRCWVSAVHERAAAARPGVPAKRRDDGVGEFLLALVLVAHGASCSSPGLAVVARPRGAQQPGQRAASTGRGLLGGTAGSTARPPRAGPPRAGRVLQRPRRVAGRRAGRAGPSTASAAPSARRDPGRRVRARPAR